ncbi:C39 family peptidase [Pseudomonas sp. MYb185]|uniref:C39 family peptidase n=1 Tax=Pseudomonas sp. MYb185 TaxID=1848729 RepID=UPI000CFD4E7E|nr:C39 family peptidase [Pseudomonas sp. MYb185]PRB82238.1 peptidase C39 [Pseudomonas sp. MYb185]
MKHLLLGLSLSVVLLPLGSGPALAAPKPFAVMPGGGLVFKPVESMRERRFVNLVQQRTDFSCGAAAMATLLNEAYGWRFSEEDVIQGMLAGADVQQVHSMGFSMLDMKRYAESLGLRARGYRLQPTQLAEVKVPSIVLLDVRGYKHFVVMQVSNEGWVYIGDPVLGHKKLTLEEFAQGWNGIVFALIGPGYNRENALLTPPEPLTASHRLDRFSPVKDADLMEFGFLQSDFF